MQSKAESTQVRLGGAVALMLAMQVHAWAATPALKAPLVATSGAKLVAPPPMVIGTVTPKAAPVAAAVAPPPPAPAPYYVSPVVFTAAKVKIHTGNDSKEAPSTVWTTLYINGGAPDDNYGVNPDRLIQLTAVQIGKSQELRTNSVTESVVKVATGSQVNAQPLALCQQHGLRLEIKYDPNFVLDAWEISRVDLEVDFGIQERWLLPTGTGHEEHREVWKPAPGYPRTITFTRSARLSDGNRKLVLVTDGFFFPK